MGKYTKKQGRQVAKASERENTLLAILNAETDSKALLKVAKELAEIRQTKVVAKAALLEAENEFECALHFKDGLPATFNSTARVLVEVSAAFDYREGENGVMHSFRRRPSYLTICAKCAKKYLIVENLTDTLEE